MAAGTRVLLPDAAQTGPHPTDVSAYRVPRLPLVDLVPHPALHRARQDGPARHTPARSLRHVSERAVSEEFLVLDWISNTLLQSEVTKIFNPECVGHLVRRVHGFCPGGRWRVRNLTLLEESYHKVSGESKGTLIQLILSIQSLRKRRRQEEEEESRALEERVKIQSLTSPTSAKEIDPKPHGVDDLSSSKVSTIGCTFGQSLVRIQKVPLSAGLVTTRYRVSPLSSSVSKLITTTTSPDLSVFACVFTKKLLYTYSAIVRLSASLLPRLAAR